MYLINLIYIYNVNTPTWIIFLAAICFAIGLALAGLFVFKKISPYSPNKANNDCISISLSTVGMFSSVLISLIVINTWDSYNNAQKIVDAEGRAVENFYRAAQGMPEPTQSILINDVKQYIDVVTKVEWPAMNLNEAINDDGWQILVHSYHVLLKLKTNDLVTANIQLKLIDQISDVFDARRDRILLTKKHIPAVIWLVICMSTVFTIVLSYLYAADNLALHMVLTGFVTASLAAALFLIVIFGHPFLGEMRIEPGTLINFQRQNLK